MDKDDIELFWSDVSDNIIDIIRLVFILGFILCSTLLFTNNLFVNEAISPIKYTTINETNYTCTANVSPSILITGWTWDFNIHNEHWIAYILTFIFITSIVFFILGMLFGYIPICGCGRC
jgi:hypothetical protein